MERTTATKRDISPAWSAISILQDLIRLRDIRLRADAWLERRLTDFAIKRCLMDFAFNECLVDLRLT